MSELKEEGKGLYSKFTLFFTVAVNLLLLFRYKYMNFFTATLLRFLPFTSRWVTQSEVALPIGISFFTFQAISYVVDVYRGTKVQKNPGYVALYISLFPQLIAGPIVRYNMVEKEIENREITVDMFSEGVLRFLRGFNKKVLLANLLAVVADASWDNGGRSVAMAWLGAFCYMLQIFFDFSGYSDMAIGLGKMLGFHFPENFNYPYISRTISEFWRRWHISLSSWFRDYMYIPLGGSRVRTKGRLVFNLYVVWLLTGIWHGANWGFLAWGAIYAFFICMEKILGMEKRVEEHQMLRWCYRGFTLLIVLLLWVLFRSEGLDIARNYLFSMLGLGGNAIGDASALFYLREYRVPLVVGILCCTPFFRKLRERCELMGKGELCNALTAVCQMVLFVFSISYLVIDAHNPFIYFNF
ncbi:MAG: MBOAT family protein [Lachnospiraceae bacterium]|nr:MBOAT family protein [Lachnospiraceae bacterium]